MHSMQNIGPKNHEYININVFLNISQVQVFFWIIDCINRNSFKLSIDALHTYYSNYFENS